MIHIEHQFMMGRYAVFVYYKRDGKRFLRNADGSVTAYDSMGIGAVVPPTFTIPEGDAKDLIKALTEAGVRPVEISKVEGQYEAQGKHLADLQNIIRTKGMMA